MPAITSLKFEIFGRVQVSSGYDTRGVRVAGLTMRISRRRELIVRSSRISRFGIDGGIEGCDPCV
ncbi:hypothetical protein BC936DRAFT_145006 [Jimgerdemannia flammicorona]|uniref:Uncharacterized protein n=1 Tax=Jimgerdemannia flammicorona TaxID=994334 RepID=A0A433DB53_9FUNG|nr:hypothetical protein BC936DRAFT_145006 [Jimgerdemannia flammicorona]